MKTALPVLESNRGNALDEWMLKRRSDPGNVWTRVMLSIFICIYSRVPDTGDPAAYGALFFCPRIRLAKSVKKGQITVKRPRFCNPCPRGWGDGQTGKTPTTFRLYWANLPKGLAINWHFISGPSPQLFKIPKSISSTLSPPSVYSPWFRDLKGESTWVRL